MDSTDKHFKIIKKASKKKKNKGFDVELTFRKRVLSSAVEKKTPESPCL